MKKVTVFSISKLAPKFGLPSISGFGLIIFINASSAFADAFPYSGYFTYQTEKPQTALMQAKCAYMFFRQNADGSGVDYILDEVTYASTGEVKYNVFGANWCEHDSKKSTDKCKQEIYDETGSTKSESFDVLKIDNKDSFSNVFFQTSFEQEMYVDSKDKTLPNWKFPTATVVYSQRCIGFSDETMKSHLTTKHSVLSQDILGERIDQAASPEKFPQILDIMQKIGVAAMNATLPGQ